MTVTSLKRSMFSNTSCFANIFLIECFRKYKSKSYLNSPIMSMEKDLSLAKKKLDCLRMKMCKGVRLRRVNIKGLAQKRQMRENLKLKERELFLYLDCQTLQMSSI